ncbi:MAG: hypothetical protein COV46_06280 [Deltaproteobacteria bacterium CG11_big_fil_rev_8_21_14_0_20_49_13]|nr:MAG: hypothetical protein COV46_06280 [Deltaproteobacteria bacterium CG11_big_fil_rev_8_21_14_0_20_49_13]
MNKKTKSVILGVSFIVLSVISIFELIKYNCVSTSIGEFCGQEAMGGAIIMIPLFFVFGVYLILRK